MNNYARTKFLIRSLVGKRLSSCEYAVILYLINQQYGYNEAKALTGDMSSYSFIATAIGFSRRQVVYALKLLIAKGIVKRISNLTSNSYQLVQ